DPAELNRVVKYGEHLYWSAEAARQRPEWNALPEEAKRWHETVGSAGVNSFDIQPRWLRAEVADGNPAATQPQGSPRGLTGAVIGIEVSHFRRRDDKGQYHD